MLVMILSITAAIIAIAMWATYYPTCRYRHGLLFAIKLPPHAVQEEAILRIRGRFRSRFAQLNLGMAIGLVPFFLLAEWPSYQIIYFLVWMTVYIAVSAWPFRNAFRQTLAVKREKGWIVGDENGTEHDPDGDSYWSNGFTYHNPEDKRVLVPKRVGIGETLNTGTRTGKWVFGGLIGMAAAVMLGTCILLAISEIKSPAMTVSDDRQIRIEYPLYAFGFAVSDIEQLALVDEVPSGIRTNGEATGKVARGHFRLNELGKARLYVYRDRPPYIRIKLKDQYVFYNEENPQATRALYGRIEAALNQAAPRSDP